MNDLPGNGAQTPKHEPFVHLCDHPGCSEWGSFGHGVWTAQEKWYCRKHDPVGGQGTPGWKMPPQA